MVYNEELVEEVRQGKLAIKNDDTKEELQKLLKHCFPQDVPSQAINYYYQRNSHYEKKLGS